MHDITRRLIGRPGIQSVLVTLIEVDKATTDDITVDGTVQAVEDSSSEMELDGKTRARSKMKTMFY